MPAFIFLTFSCLIFSFISLWIRKDFKIWGSLLGLSLTFGLIAGAIDLTALPFIFLLIFSWSLYQKNSTIFHFLLILVVSALFKMHLIPGFTPFLLTSKFGLGLQSPLIGFFPLALYYKKPDFNSEIVPLSRTLEDYKAVFKGLSWGILGILLIASLAILTKAIKLHFKIPTFFEVRLLSNFFLTCIPEEGLFRGFIQTTLCNYFRNLKLGKTLGLLLSSFLFTFHHLSWSPNPQILAFVFIASLLYGGVYLISKKIESAILCHFLLNFFHMTFFSYHAL